MTGKYEPLMKGKIIVNIVNFSMKSFVICTYMRCVGAISKMTGHGVFDGYNDSYCRQYIAKKLKAFCQLLLQRKVYFTLH